MHSAYLNKDDNIHTKSSYNLQNNKIEAVGIIFIPMFTKKDERKYSSKLATLKKMSLRRTDNTNYRVAALPKAIEAANHKVLQ